jgi:WD domain, G-beta repeat
MGDELFVLPAGSVQKGGPDTKRTMALAVFPLSAAPSAATALTSADGKQTEKTEGNEEEEEEKREEKEEEVENQEKQLNTQRQHTQQSGVPPVSPPTAERLVVLALSDVSVRGYLHNAAGQFGGRVAVHFERPDARTVLSMARSTWRSEESVRQLVVSGSTNGNLDVWDLTSTLAELSTALLALQQKKKKREAGKEHDQEGARRQQQASKVGPAAPLALSLASCAHVRTAHLSGVNCVSAQMRSRDRMLVLSGGDDQQLRLTQVLLPSAGSRVQAQVSVLRVIRSAHTSSLKGCAFWRQDLLVSTSSDQRLRVWRWQGASSSSETSTHVDRSAPSASGMLEVDIFMSVGDVAGLSVNALEKRTSCQPAAFISVVGSGLQCCEVRLGCADRNTAEEGCETVPIVSAKRERERTGQ